MLMHTEKESERVGKISWKLFWIFQVNVTNIHTWQIFIYASNFDI